MPLNNFSLWLLALWNLFSFAVYGYSKTKKGNAKVILEFVGGLSLVLSYLGMFFLFGFKTLIIFVIASFLLAAPIIGFITAAIINKRSKNVY